MKIFLTLFLSTFIANVALAQWTNVSGTNDISTTNPGNAGIGTTTPLNKLDVVGGISLSNAGSNVLRILQSVNAAGYSGPGTYSQTDMAYGVNSGGKHIWIGINGNTEIMRLDPNGKLGIGTSTPLGLLSLNNQVNNGTSALNYPSYSTTAGQSVFNSYYVFNSDGSGPYPRYLDIASVGSPDGTNGGGNIRFLTNPITTNASAVERMRIASNGNVGIRNSAPLYPLDVNGAGRFEVDSPDTLYNSLLVPLTLVNNGGNQGSGAQINFQLYHATSYINSIVDGPNANTGTALTFGTPSSETLGTERMRITSAGAVGIGTAAPTAKLTVSSNAANATLMSFQSHTGATWAIGPNVGSTSGDDTFGIYSYTYGPGHSDDPLIQFNSTGNTYINPNGGNVGVGTTSPDEKLSVNGNIHAQEILVNLTGFEDKVFYKTYHLPALNDVKNFIDKNHHLPEVPSEAEVIKNGIKVGDMERTLTKKVEELTLYLIKKDEQLTQQQKLIKNQQKINKDLAKRIQTLENTVK